MKKLLIILMPMFIILGIVFAIQQREFDSHTFLQKISTMEFTSLTHSLNLIKNNAQDITNLWNGSQDTNILESIFLTIWFIAKGILLFVYAIITLISDLLNDVGIVMSAIFG